MARTLNGRGNVSFSFDAAKETDGQAAMQNGDDTDFFFIPIIKGVNPKPGRETNITYTHLDDATASAHETEWKQWYKEKFVQ